VEINALWINALETMAGFARLLAKPNEAYERLSAKAREVFRILERGAQLLLRRRRFTGHRNDARFGRTRFLPSPCR